VPPSRSFPFRWGRALINRRLNIVHDVNFLIADQLDGADAESLAAEADRIQGDAGISHRRVNVDDQLAADRMAPAFVAAGYQTGALRRDGAPPGSQPAGRHRRVCAKVDWAQLRPERELERRGQPWSSSQALWNRSSAKQELTGSRIDTPLLWRPDRWTGRLLVRASHRGRCRPD